MRVYQNLGVNDEKVLPQGTLGVPFRIERAKLVKEAYGNKPVLALELREKRKSGYVCGYGLIGSDLIRKFRTDMKIGKIEELVGKEVFGFLSPSRDFLKGLAIRN